MTRRVEPDDPLFDTARIHAVVTVRVFLGMDGSIVCSRVVGKTNPLLAKASLRAAGACRFSPLSNAGYKQPVQGDVVFHIDR